MKRFVIFHDYGAYDGWKIFAETDDIVEAIRLREADIANGGGVSEIFMFLPLKEAYAYAAIADPFQLPLGPHP